MLERYFLQPKTVDRIRSSWLAEPIEQYVRWLTERNYTASSVTRRVEVLMRLGEFARQRGVGHVRDLAGHVEAFLRHRIRRRRGPFTSAHAKRAFIADLKRGIEQMLRVVVPPSAKTRSEPLAQWAPSFFAYLREERGLRDPTVQLYRHHLARFEEYASHHRVRRLDTLTPTVLDGFLTEARRRNCPRSLNCVCSALRTFLRYAFREGHMPVDLSGAVEGPRTYRLAEIPRAVAWDDVMRTLKSVDRRSPLGKRDYAILLLLTVYGMRAREVAALTLDDIEWRTATLFVRGRKAGHATSYPLAPQVRDALIDYLQHGRPTTTDRRIFMLGRAPRVPITARIVAVQARQYLRAAGAQAPRLGSHTLRHSVAQRLVQADFSLKVIGDYLGHRSPSSTQIYSKVSIESLREIALGDGEEIL
jgi:integrase/recombinase XerD